MKRCFQVLVLAGDMDGNLGDRAIVYSMCRHFKYLNPKVQIHIVSSNPDADRTYFKSRTIPRGFTGLLKLLCATKKSDLILCGGGGLFQDDDSLVKMPYWFCRIALARLVNPKAKMISYSLGVGPLRRPVSRFLAQLSFACMDIISVRDPLAQKIAELLTSKPVRIVPDPALLLPADPPEKARSLLAEHGIPIGTAPLIGVAVRKWFHQSGSVIPHKYAFKYHLRRIPGNKKCEKMVSLLAGVLDRLVAEENAYIIFLPTYNVLHEADDVICCRIAARMKTQRKRIIRIEDPRLYKAVTGHLSVMLGGRMHPTIFSYGMDTNIVGLSYNQKFKGFFELIGSADNVLDINEFVDLGQTVELYNLLSEAIKKGVNSKRQFHNLANQVRAFNSEIIQSLTV